MSNKNEKYVSIVGYGSLLSQTSAKSTFPNLRNFRKAIVRDYRRVFAHIAAIFYERKIANEKTKEVSSLSTEPCKGEFLIVSLFEIPYSEMDAFYEREDEFRFTTVIPENMDGTSTNAEAIMCTRFSDEEYRKRCKTEQVYYEKYGKYGIEKIWRDDILPCRVYLRHCVLAAQKFGKDVLDNFLDHTYLGDRKTTIRQYLEKNPDIMNEEPPEHLKNRYSG